MTQSSDEFARGGVGRRIWSWRTYLLWTIVCVGIVAIGLWKDFGGKLEKVPEYAFTVIFSGAVASAFYYGIFVMLRLGWGIAGKRVEALKLTQQTEELQERLDSDFFTNLVRINFKYLDKYYLQTQEQADKSFLLSLTMGVAGFVVLAAGIVLMFFPDQGGAVTPAYVTSAAGVISEFIAAVFFYLYNRTIQSMGLYHQKLVITQNIALALRITNDLPDQDRAKAQLDLIAALIKDVNQLLTAGAEASEVRLRAAV